MRILKGDVYYCNFGEDNVVGSEQMGVRPVVIIQNNIGNRFSPTVIVATVTTRRKKELPTHVILDGYKSLEPKCTVLLEQLRTVDKERLGSYITTLNYKDILRVDEAILTSMGINMPKTDKEI